MHVCRNLQQSRPTICDEGEANNDRGPLRVVMRLAPMRTKVMPKPHNPPHAHDPPHMHASSPQHMLQHAPASNTCALPWMRRRGVERGMRPAQVGVGEWDVKKAGADGAGGEQTWRPSERPFPAAAQRALSSLKTSRSDISVISSNPKSRFSACLSSYPACLPTSPTALASTS